MSDILSLDGIHFIMHYYKYFRNRFVIWLTAVAKEPSWMRSIQAF